MNAITEFYKHTDTGWEQLKTVSGYVPNLAAHSMVLHDKKWYRVKFVETVIYDDTVVQHVCMVRRNPNEL